ncbi:MAG: SH3 domain-containing protein, partial [Bdellovibrionota bacterium]
APLYEGPGPKFKKIFDVPKGVSVEASNVPVEGYYKVRLPNGRVGWLSSDTLVFAPKKVGVPSINYPTALEPEAVNTQSALDKKKSHTEHKSVNFALIGGFDLFNASEINQRYSFSGLSNGIGFGGEFSFYPSSSVGIVVRFEKLSKSINVVDETSVPYTFSLSSIPFMIGVEIPISKEANSGLTLGILLGIAASTQFTGTATNFALDNVTTYSGTGMGALFKFDYNFALSGGFGFFTELGYRYLRTSSLAPGLALNGSNIFKDINGNPISFTLDMSGVILGGGMRFTF